MRTIGRDVSEQDVIVGLGPSRISPTLGLLDASGAGIVQYLAEQGIGAESNSEASWAEVMGAAGYQPMVIGGRAWYHWVAVRMGSEAAESDTTNLLALMNPSPGYMDVGHWLDEEQFADLGAFTAVWFTSW